MAKRVIHSAPHLWNVHLVDDGLVFEQGTYNASPVFWHATADGVREIARLPLGRPRGVLQGVEEDALICVEADGTLSSFRIRDGRRTVLRTLVPIPAAVAVTPEQVVWAKSETRFLDGDGTHAGAGEVWRWWRGTDVVEKLGEHEAFRPDLVVARTAALGPSAITAPVYLAADQRLALIETDGMRWIAELDQPIGHLACSSDAVFYTSKGAVLRQSYATGETSVIQRVTIPMGLAVHRDLLVVLRGTVIDRREVVETSGAIVVDLRNGSAQLIAENLARPGAVAAGDAGIAVVEGAIDYGGTDRLVMLDWTRGTPLAAAPPLDDAIWQYPLSVQWWRPDGDGGYFQLDRDGSWRLHGSTPARGTIDPVERIARLREWEVWRRARQSAAGAYVDLSITRGWQVAWGVDAWFRAAVPDSTPASAAVAAARDLVIRLCPAFADVVAAMP